MMPPALAPPPGPDPTPDPEPALDPAPFDPYPPEFGPVTTLQNVAVISSSQITPVVGAVVEGCDVANWPL